MSEKIILGSLLFLISFPGNAFLMALIQFDRIGGDPLKRRITDQVSLKNAIFPLIPPFCHSIVFPITVFCFNGKFRKFVFEMCT